MRNAALLLCLSAAGIACNDGSNRNPTEPEVAAADPALSATMSAPLAFRLISAGVAHICGVTTDNQGFCWGDNLFGQLGIGEAGGVRPRPRPVLGNLSFRSIEAGSSHNCGVTTLNRAYCWGNNQEGGLGDGTRMHRSTPVAVLGGHRFRQVTAGLLFSCGVRTDAAGYCWGDNGVGSLGDGTTIDRTRPAAVAAP